MALSFAHGAIQWTAASTVGATFTVSGLSFQPKAIRVYWMGMQTASDGTATNLDMQRGIGFATSTSDRRCVGTYDDDASANMNCGAGYRTDAIAVTLDGSTTVVGLLDLTAINSDGFVLTVDDQTPQGVTIFWEAWGGTDIVSAATGEIAEPAATGDVDYTVTGSFQPDVVMFAGCQATGAAQTTEATSSGFCAGFASSGTSTNNIVVAGSNVDAGGSSDTYRLGLSGECLAMIPVAGGNPDARATLTQFNADGFRLNWIARATTGRKSIYLAIEGGSWDAGPVIMAGVTIGSTATISGLSFQPIGICAFTGINIVTAAGASASQDAISMGTASSTSSRQSMAVLNTDAATNASVNLGIQYDRLLTRYNNTANIDLSSFNSDGFTIIRTDANEGGTLANMWIGYLVFASEPAVARRRAFVVS